MPNQDYPLNTLRRRKDTMPPARTAQIFARAWGDDAEATLCTYLAEARPDEIGRWLRTVRALRDLRQDQPSHGMVTPPRASETVSELKTILSIIKLCPHQSCTDAVALRETAALFVTAWGDRAEAILCFHLADAQPSETGIWLNIIRALMRIRSSQLTESGQAKHRAERAALGTKS